MSISVFCGPSVAGLVVTQRLGHCEVLPPVRAGNVRDAVKRGAQTIAIIDGFFEQVPSVWHKEILFALAQGVWVVAGASMGALRAAELWPYGVIGVGRIFEAYRDGVFEDDDEVAVVHSPADDGYRELSTSMADIRFGLQDAQDAGAITQEMREALVNLAKSSFYAERSWRALWQRASIEMPTQHSALARVRVWIEEHRPSQKRRDALLVLDTVGELVARTRGARFQAEFDFEETSFWNAVNPVVDSVET
jgi:hypothetical protein